MRQVPDWDEYFLALAKTTATRSKDPNTQVGAVIVNPDGRIISQGYNGMPQGRCEHASWDDDVKDDLVIHAELNAVANAARSGVSTLGGTMYVTLPPCLPCARVIAAAGLKKVVFPQSSYDDWVGRKPAWRERFGKALRYLSEAVIDWRLV